MTYIIVDLEATCWKKRRDIRQMEIIEIGAVRLCHGTEDKSDNMQDEFSSFVRPVAEPVLSEFCKELTSIRQADVDAADDFKTVFIRFLEWIGPDPYVLCSWGAYDLKQIEVDCRRHGIPLPEGFHNHYNLKEIFASQRSIRPCGMRRALRILDIPHEGTHHRALSDARNIAKIAMHVLP